ncbi:MAG: hypothetical protein SFY81_04605 [Verrucomicrobiota bacterium]|nr:hypothetical protein [Verrucomicrobiota bacterium]
MHTSTKKILFSSLALLAGVGITSAQTPTIPASAAVPASSVDTTKRGFQIRIHQIGAGRTGFADANSTAAAESQLAGLQIDPATNEPWVNLIDTTAEGFVNGLFIETDVINYNQASTPEAPTAGAAGAFTPDDPIPGIGTDNNNIAMETITYLELPAGTNTFGVNSDDGFKVSFASAANIRDMLAQTVGEFSGGRGSADTIFSFKIDQAGIYPVRLVWWEGGGGANVEFFSVDADGLTKHLINDPADPAAIKAYQTSTALPNRAYATLVTPANNQTGVQALPTISARFSDDATQISQSSIRLSLNGTLVTPTIGKTGVVTYVDYQVPTPLPPLSTNTIELIYSDNGTPAVTSTQNLSFVVNNYQTLVAGTARPAGTVDTSEANRGFTFNVHQADTTPDLANSTERAEAQLRGYLVNPATGEPYPNNATPGDTGTTFRVQVINMSQEGDTDTDATTGLPVDQGVFRASTNETLNFPDAAIPGIPAGADAAAVNNNIAGEFIAYLDLPAGVTTFGVNSDDGFRLYTGSNPYDRNNQSLGAFEGGRGGDTGTVFDIVTPTAGIYPIRLIWYEGGGGANVEFYTIKNGQRILVNDPSNPNAIKAYATSTAPNGPVVDRFSPANNAVATKAATIDIQISDKDSAVIESSLQLLVNGTAVTPTTGKTGAVTVLSYDPPGDLTIGSTQTVILRFTSDSTPAVNFSYTNQFVIGGELIRRIFTEVNGGSVNDLRNSAKYKDNLPDRVEAIPAYETPDQGIDNYGGEVLGYIRPKVSGDYEFWIAADDNAELWLSTDENPANRVLIARVTAWDNYREYTSSGGGSNLGVGGKRSGKITLQAGQRYFTQGFWKEGGGGDNFAVTWTPFGTTAVNGTPGISGPEIEPFTGVVFTSTGSTNTYLAGRSLSLSTSFVAANGGTAMQWLKGGTPVPDATTGSLNIASLATTDSGDYRLRVTDGTTEYLSPIFRVTVNADAVLPTVVRAGITTTGWVALEFSEQLTLAAAETAANYTVNGNPVDGVVQLTADGKYVLIQSSEITGTGTVTVGVAGVTDLAGNSVAANTSVVAVRDTNTYIDSVLGNPAPTVAGAAFSVGEDDYILLAGGADIWGPNDQGRFLGQKLAPGANFEAVVQIEHLESVNRWSKAGISVREGTTGTVEEVEVVDALTGNARALTAYVTPVGPTDDAADSGQGNNVYEAGVRAAVGGDTVGWQTSNPPPPFPNAWLRVTREGNTYRAFWGTNGTTWTQYASRVFATTNSIYVGLALTSHNDTGAEFLADAKFSNFSITVIDDVPTPTIGISRTGNTITISYTGVLQSRSSLTEGTWADVTGAPTGTVAAPATYNVNTTGDTDVYFRTRPATP